MTTTKTTQATETLIAYDYTTGTKLGELTAEQSAAYLAELETLVGSQREIGAVDGSDYGYPGRTIYAQ